MLAEFCMWAGLAVFNVGFVLMLYEPPWAALINLVAALLATYHAITCHHELVGIENRNTKP